MTPEGSGPAHGAGMQQKVCLELGFGSALQESFLLGRRQGSNSNHMQQADKQTTKPS